MILIAQLCFDAAVFRKISQERKGVSDLRKRAFEDIIEMDFAALTLSTVGRAKLAFVSEYLHGESYQGETNDP